MKAADIAPQPPRRLKQVLDEPRLVRIDFDLQYLECDLAPRSVESNPVLQMYLTDHFVRDADTGGVVNIHLDDRNLSKHYTGSLIGTLKREYDTVPPIAGIGMASYAVHKNDYGSKCYVNVGTSHLMLDDVLNDIRANGVYDHTHSLLMRTVLVAGHEPVQKGVVELRVSAVNVGSRIRLHPRNQVMSLLQSPVERLRDTLNQYIESTLTIETVLPDTMGTATNNMRAPYNISEIGIEFTKQALLPVASFGIAPTPVTNAGYWRNAYERVMARRNMTHQRDWIDFDVREKARTMSLMICYGIQTFDYIGDAIEYGSRLAARVEGAHIGNEEFSNLWYTLCGDCEDGGKALATSLNAFLSAKLDSKRDAHLIEMQQLAQQYVPLNSLAVVNGAKIGDNDKLGAHMYLPMFTRAQFLDGLSKTSAGRQLIERLPASFKGNVRTDLPHAVCEGTGHLDTVGEPFNNMDQRRYVAQNMPSILGIKTQVPYNGKESTFYRALLMGTGDHLMTTCGINVGSFTFGHVNDKYNPQDEKNRHEMTRGELFTAVVQHQNTLAIMPHPIIPQPVMSLIRDVIGFAPPVRALVLDDTRIAPAEITKNADLDRFVQAVKGFKRNAPSVPVPTVDLYLRPHHFSAATVSRWINDASRMERLYDAEYVLERVTDDIHNYRMKLYVK
jgi:putative component of toxin-antitoxin plasmid stabilization module